jgi:dipeptidyl-peptidase 4
MNEFFMIKIILDNPIADFNLSHARSFILEMIIFVFFKTKLMKNSPFIALLFSISAFSCSTTQIETNSQVTANPERNSQTSSANSLSNELIWYSGEFYGKSVRGVSSMNDGKHFTTLDNGENGPEVNKYSYATYEKVATLFTFMDLKDEEGNPIPIDEYQFNADETKVMIATDQESIYRRSSKSFYYIYDLKTKKTTPLSDKKLGKQRLAEISPAGIHVAFVRENNLFFMNLETGKEFAITTSGELNKLIHGATDWVYEEEFAIHKGFEWNENGTKIAYLTFDESEVREFHLDYYGPLYPMEYRFKYPKAGEDNSKVSVSVYDIWKQESLPVVINDIEEYYIPRIKWTKNSEFLSITKLNRLQNKLELLQVNCLDELPQKKATLEVKPFYTETAKTYIDIHDNLTFLADNNTYLWMSEKDGFNHIYLNTLDGKETQVTKGNWDVIEIQGMDEENGLIYYLSAENGATQQELYVVSLDGSNKKKLSARKGNNSTSFSKGMKYFVNYHSDANTPSFISLHEANGKQIKVLEDNQALRDRLEKYDLPSKEFFQFDNGQGTKLNAWMIKPAGFDPNKTYPVFMTGYNGPGNNVVTDSWGGSTMMWHHLLAKKGFLVVCVETRGTMYRGRDFKHSTYLQLGKLETEDLISAAKHIGGLPFADANNIGIQGWSYGGYMASLCMTKGADYFKAGIAVAPVTNWRYYDNIYTERFMRKPQENGNGYDDNSPINHVNKLNGKFLIVHGGGDDNVHPQNTYEMVNALVKENKEFDMFIYPNRNHGIYGGKTRLHLFNKMTNFLEDNLMENN